MKYISIALGALALAAIGLSAQHPLNFSFETPSVEGFERPWGWNGIAGTSGTASLDSTVSRTGQRSLRFNRDHPDGFMGLRYWIAPRFALGTQVEISAHIRVDPVTTGTPFLVLETWGGERPESDTVALSTGSVSSDWHTFSAGITVDPEAHSVVVTLALSGAGTVWYEDLSIRTPNREWQTVPVASAPRPADLNWIRGHTTPLQRIGPADPGSPDHNADLLAFHRIVGDAHVVALGEATHGTSEFFQIKHRLLQSLVEEMGFRVFLIEANQLVVERINRYVLGGPGDTPSVMRTMFAVWNTHEMAELIDWMRQYNRQHPGDPVEFIGFDMQDPTHPIDSLLDFLERSAPHLHPVADSLYQSLRDAWEETQYPWRPDAVRAQWRDNAEAMAAIITAHSAVLYAAARSAADSNDIQWAVQNANVVRQSALSSYTQVLRTRDSSMAENIRWSLNGRPAGTRAVVWAHDAHIAKADAPRFNYFYGDTMGGYLRRMYGASYRPVGLMTFDGRVTGWLRGSPIAADLFPAPRGSVEEALHRIAAASGAIGLVLDLQQVGIDPDSYWLTEPRVVRFLGYAAEDWGFATPIAVGHQFDAIVYIDTTTPSRLVGRQ